MNYDILCQKRERLEEMQKHLPKEALESFDKSFEIEYTHWKKSGWMNILVSNRTKYWRMKEQQ